MLQNEAMNTAIPGFCLSHMEVLNWGTFNKHVWVLPTNGQNALLTGDIGSGKSTLVDAITALLVPPRRITFNKAAGAEGRERSLKSYIRGEYKSVQTQQMNSRAESLRDDSGYSVILAQFHHAIRSQTVTLAQVLWMSEGKHMQFFLIADAALTIAEAFSGQEGTVSDLKKSLKRMPSIEVFESFKPYAISFRKRMGIRHEKALELFNQTISMKSVGNLTGFVREHMLEPGRLMERVDTLKRDFDNLNQAHAAVLKARKQIEILEPMLKLAKEHQQLQSKISKMTHCRDYLDGWIAWQKTSLLDQKKHKLEEQQRREQARLDALNREIGELRLREQQLRQSIDDNGGRRIVELEAEIIRLGEERDRKQTEAGRYKEAVQILDLPMASDADTFHQHRETCLALSSSVQGELEALNKQMLDEEVAMRTIQQQCQTLEQEINSLKQRRSNIPFKSLQIRAQMIAALKLDESDVPFIGELLQVQEHAAEWEGAIERLLHNFGLSMLVPDHLYAKVSEYVEQTNLKGRLVYFRVQDSKKTWQEAASGTVLSKLSIKQDSPLRHWLYGELYKRFTHICCDTMDNFRRHPFAISKAGQIKAGGTRHEKDDRNQLFDRSRFVLGWSNQAKIKALKHDLKTLEERGSTHFDQLALFRELNTILQSKKVAMRDLLRIEKLDDIDWQSVAQKSQQLQQEKQRIKEGSDVLRELEQQLQDTQANLTKQDEAKSVCDRGLGELNKSLQDVSEQHVTATEQVETVAKDMREAWFPAIAQQCQSVLGERTLNLRSLEKQQSEVRQSIQLQINQLTQKSDRRTNAMQTGMSNYKHAYPAETGEVDASLESWPEYAMMLEALQRDDLPKHEQRFKEMLHEGTIQGIVLLRTQLEKEKKSIRDKINDINRSLHDIEYNQGSYIRLQADEVSDADIREFEAELRQCISGTLDTNSLYNEKRFNQVKGLVDHFNEDPYWAKRVSDVRNWFNFSAIELWCEDDSQKEFYSDSSGKSGGQKEKLAYTILASSLAYQFGVTEVDEKNCSFRFVVIDEAFGRGSDESARYALELFGKLGLQLLIVTPMQKIHVIADYVQSVHLVHNEEGRNSVIRSVSIEEYRKDKEMMQQA